MSRVVANAAFFFLIVLANVGYAWQETPGGSAQASITDAGLAQKLRSPRDTIRVFLKGVREGRLDEAAQCLDLSDVKVTGEALDTVASRLAVRLKDVIDRTAFIVYEDISDDPDGDAFRLADYLGTRQNVTDKLLADAARIAIDRDPQGLWRFTPETVAAIDELHRRSAAREQVAGQDAPVSRPLFLIVEDLFPASMRTTHFLLPDYQWVCLLILIFVGFVADMLTRSVLRQATGAWFRYFRKDQSFEIDRSLWKPLGLLAQALTWYLGTRFVIGLQQPQALAVLLVVLKLFAVFAAVWTAFRLTDLFGQYMRSKAENTDTKFDDLLVPLVTRSSKVFIVAVGIITCAQAFGMPLAGLLGGVGITGMAIAFASQDAISNIFGSLMVLADRPFEIGDWIVAGDVEGTVEEVGFRSTRIRTFYNSQITLPNSRLTTTSVDNMGRRRFRRIKTMLSVQYNTPPDRLDAFCEGVRELLRRHPYTRKDYYHVYVNQFTASSIDVLLYCFVECPDWSVELREKHRLYLDILKLAQELEISFAFPTRTVHLHNAPPESAPTPLDDPFVSGQQHGANVAGPLLDESRRPGGVEFRGPSEFGAE